MYLSDFYVITSFISSHRKTTQKRHIGGGSKTSPQPVRSKKQRDMSQDSMPSDPRSDGVSHDPSDFARDAPVQAQAQGSRYPSRSRQKHSTSLRQKTALQKRVQADGQQADEEQQRVQAAKQQADEEQQQVQVDEQQTDKELSKSGSQLRLLSEENAQLKAKNKKLEVEVKRLVDASKVLEDKLKEQADELYNQLKDANKREQDLRQQLEALLKEKKDEQGIQTEKQHTDKNGSFSGDTILISEWRNARRGVAGDAGKSSPECLTQSFRLGVDVLWGGCYSLFWFGFSLYSFVAYFCSIIFHKLN